MKREPLSPSAALLNVVVLATLAGVLAALWLLYTHSAWDYYTTPLSIRGYAPAHRALRPSGSVGHLLGAAGTVFLFLTLLYVARKRVKWLSKAGSPVGWLEFHIFCGVFGPILITYHTSLKFNGIVSVAYWSMALVVLSGFIGRYLYVRIPKTIRGQELTAAEITQRAAEVKARLAETRLPVRLLEQIDDVDQAIAAGAWGARRQTAALRREIRRTVHDRALLHQALDLAAERAVLLRRIARLETTRRLFKLWHVFHRPLVWVMFGIFFVHLGVAIYFGYTVFGR